METIFATFDPTTNADTGGRVVVDKGIRGHLTPLERRFPHLFPIERTYRTAKGRDISLHFDSLEAGVRLLNNEVVGHAARALVKHLSTTGQVPGMQRRWHVPELADLAIGSSPIESRD